MNATGDAIGPQFNSLAPYAMPRLFPVQQDGLTSDDYYTPRWLFDRMGITFDLDVCAPPGGVPWIPATRATTTRRTTGSPRRGKVECG